MIVPLAAAVELPFQVLASTIERTASPTFAEQLQAWQKALADDPATPFPTIKTGQIAAFAGSNAISFLAGSVLAAVVASIVMDVYARRPLDRRTALRTGARRGPLMLLATIAATLAAATAAAMVAVPAAFAGRDTGVLGALIGLPIFVWIYFRLTPAHSAIVIERVGPVRALRRSAELIRGRWWRVLGIVIIGGLITAIPIGIIQTLVQGILNAAGGDNAAFTFVWKSIASTIAFALVAPLLSILTVLVYIDLRVRKEGLDVDALLSGATPVAKPPRATAADFL